MVITLVISVVLSGKLIRYNLLLLLKDITPYLLTALACATLSFFLTQKIENALLYVILNVITISTSYILLCKLMKFDMLKEIELWFAKWEKR